MLTLHLDLKIIFSLQYGKSLYTVRLSLLLKSGESLPKYGKTKLSSLLGTMKLRTFYHKKHAFLNPNLGRPGGNFIPLLKL